MREFATGAELLLSDREEPPMSTGSPELDSLVGGIRRNMFYLFYSSDKQLIETLFMFLVTNALKHNNRGLPRVAYMLCGNYRKERTNLAIEELAELVEDSGFYMEEAFQRLIIFTASSADQQALLVNELLKLLEREENVSLVLIRGIFKLHFDDARVKDRHVVREEVQRSIGRLRQVCAERGIPIVASAREIKVKGEVQPRPESSSFLMHAANVIIYLRRRQKGSRYNRAFLIDHPTRPPGSLEYHFVVNEELGRETKPFRQSFQEMVERLRHGFKEPLVSQNRKTAFELLVEAWASELGAMSFSEGIKMLDLILLVSVIENRSILENVLKQLERIRN
jgi:KaiC/GvpD/RAD55 family RecA-like ATPase